MRTFSHSKPVRLIARRPSERRRRTRALQIERGLDLTTGEYPARGASFCYVGERLPSRDLAGLLNHNLSPTLVVSIVACLLGCPALDRFGSPGLQRHCGPGTHSDEQ
jgi:hypothetical protein